jgi:ectoine hydroxylase-related dioxygenase (phytanoyl-CoA dioxygenase family)
VIFYVAFAAGDILIFTMRTIHMSSVNLTNRLRLSCDTRWQPYDQTIDPRFKRLEGNDLLGHTDIKFGLHAHDSNETDDETTTIKQLRQQWGFSNIQS